MFLRLLPEVGLLLLVENLEICSLLLRCLKGNSLVMFLR